MVVDGDPDALTAVGVGQRVVDWARRLGADEAEAYLGYDRTWSARGQGRRLLWMRHADARGLGLRAVRDGAVGYAYASLPQPDPDDDTIREVTAQALATAGITTAAEIGRAVLPHPDRAPAEVPGLFTPAVAEWDPRRARAVIAEIAELAFEGTGVRDVPRIHYGVEDSIVAVASTRGVAASYRCALHYAWAETWCDDGEGVQAGSYSVWSRGEPELPAAWIGARSAAVAASYRGAAPAPTGHVPVVIAPTAAVNLLNRLAIVLSAETVRRGRSLVSGLGEMLGSPELTVVDDPTLPGGLGSRPVDGEGIASRRRVLIDRGRVVGLLHDSATAAEVEAPAGANATRSSYRALPRPGPSNLFIAPGQCRPEQLLHRAGDGLYVTEMMGLHGTNPASGRFSVAVRGYRIRDGALAEPVADTALSGSYAQLLRGTVAVGDDLEFPPSRGGCGSPTLLVSELAVVGEGGERG